MADSREPPRILRLWRFGRVVADVHDEFAFHLDMRTRELIAGGMNPEAARAEALHQFGDLRDATTYCRRSGERRERRLMRIEWIGGLRQDAAFAWRALSRAPMFTTVAVLTLALGIGANTAIFSVVRGVLLRPFPFAEPDRLVMVAGGVPGKPSQFYFVSPANASDWRAQNKSFTDMAIINTHGAVLTNAGASAEVVQAAFVSPGYFNILGVKPLAGRAVFDEAEGAWQGEKAVVISAGLWQSRFGSNPAIVGSMITLDNDRYRVVGIVPTDQAWPQGIVAWMPFTYDPATLANSRGAIYLNLIARLRPGVTLAAAGADMNGVTRRLLAQFPRSNAGDAESAHVVPLNEWVSGSLRTPLLVLLGGVGFVLLIACANVANLLMVRGVSRSGELAVRTALGAGRGRLVRLLVAESVLLSIIGGVGATVLAWFGTRMLVHAAPTSLPRLTSIRIDGVVLGVTFGIALVVGLIFGLVPASQLVRTDLAQSLRAGGRGLGRSGAGSIGRRALVIAEVALSVILMAGAGLLIRSFTRLTHVDPGFRTEHSIHYDVSLPATKYPTQEVRWQLLSTLLDRMRTVHGVQTAGASFGMPLTPFGFALTFTVDGRPPVPPAQQVNAQIRLATPDYFKTMSITMQRGRNFTDGDRMGAPKVLLINAAGAAKFFPGEDPIGKTVHFGMSDGDNHLEGEIVGIANDVKQASLARPAAPQFWIPFAQYPMSSFDMVLHTAGDPNVAINEARRDLHELDSDLAMTGVMTLDDMVAGAVAQPRFYMTLLGVFAALALVLSAIGIYGVIAYLVSQRTREIGIRIALGAAPGAVVRLMVGEGALMIGTGLLAGMAGALTLTRLMTSLLFDTTSTDPGTYGMVIAVLAGVGLVAAVVPALRAARVDPVLAMRAE